MMMVAQVEIEDQESVTNSDTGEIFDSLSDNADSSLAGDHTVHLREGNPEYDVVRNLFLSGMGPLSNDTKIVTIRKISTERITTKAKFVAFKLFSEAMARKNGGDANAKHGWYSGSKKEIERIVSYGFSNREIVKSHGIGIHLIHHTCSLAAAVVCEGDEEGVKYLLLCRLILGKPEVIVSGSNQSHPSEIRFDSGVDNLENPRKYVIWSSTMNSYILPSHVVSFKSRRLRARSPFVSLAVLMTILSKSLDPTRMSLILRTYDDFRKRKLRRDQLVRKMREIVGDELLLEIIKNHHNMDQE